MIIPDKPIYAHTDSQIEVFEEITNPTAPVSVIQAFAGSSKTYSLVEGVQQAIDTHGKLKIRYLIFGSLAAIEAKAAFGPNAIVSTLHAYAYANVIKQYRLNPNIAPFLSWRDIPKHIKKPFGVDRVAIYYIEEYCNSKYLNFSDFRIELQAKDDPFNILAYRLASQLLDEMANGKMRITHGFYLKFFHILVMNGAIKLEAMDKVIVDECLSGDSKVKLEGGATYTMLNLYNKYKSGKPLPRAKSFNEATKQFEFKDITNVMYTGERQTYAVKTEGLNKLVCTDNHKLLTQRGWVEVKDIAINKDYVLLDKVHNQKCKYLLSDKQEQMVLASYLGDGSLTKQSELNTYRIKFTQGIAQQDYLDFKLKAFPNTAYKLIKSGYTGQLSINQSNYTSTFIMGNDPLDLVLDKLDARGLAIWLMDDGSSNSTYSIIIHSNSFTKEENTRLIDMLKTKFGVEATLRKSRSYYEIQFNKEATILLRKIVQPYMHPYFIGKFGVPAVSTLYDWSSTYREYGGNFITSITPHLVQPTYDITVADNHNFVTIRSNSKSSGMIVHNCQDLSSISLDIFEAIPATQKIMIGDELQQIFGFLNLENGFDRYPKAKQLQLNKSFRVDAKFAPQINDFMSKHLGSTTEFVGMEYPDKPSIITKAYLTRTNSSLIGKMIQLNKLKIPYHLATKTKVKQMFKWPLALVYAKAGHKQLDPELKHFQRDLDEHHKTKVIHGMGLYEYLNKRTTVPPQLKQAMMLLLKYNKELIIMASVEALKHQKTKCNLTLMTAHNSKGSTLDSIELDPDINMSVDKVLKKKKHLWDEDDLSELKLAYVAVTRHRHELIGCDFLDDKRTPDELTE